MIHLPHLETNITTACTNHCVNCNHLIPLQKPSYIDPQELERDLSVFTKIAHAAAYAIIGGEPLMHLDLVNILKIAKQSGIADKIELWTNGTLLKRMPREVWQNTDEMIITLYPGKQGDDFPAWCMQKAAENGTRIQFKDGSRFTRLLSDDPQGAGQRYSTCWYRTFCHVLDNGYFYRCCSMPFLSPVLAGEPRGYDGIAIDGLTEEQLTDYLHQSLAPESCKLCAGHGAGERVWAEERDRYEWIAKSLK